MSGPVNYRTRCVTSSSIPLCASSKEELAPKMAILRKIPPQTLPTITGPNLVNLINSATSFDTALDEIGVVGLSTGLILPTGNYTISFTCDVVNAVTGDRKIDVGIRYLAGGAVYQVFTINSTTVLNMGVAVQTLTVPAVIRIVDNTPVEFLVSTNDTTPNATTVSFTIAILKHS